MTHDTQQMKVSAFYRRKHERIKLINCGKKEEERNKM